jgi:16S rRNA (uracil1498-N3)-methyltransferase
VGGVCRREAVRRFLIEAGELGETVRLSEAEALHARRVLRLKPGDRVQLLNGQGALYEAELIEVCDWVTARLHARLDGAPPPVRLTLYQGLPKFDKLEFIAQKAAELGATRLVPVRMSRSVVKLSDEDARRKRERLDKIAREAMKQCGRADFLEIAEPVKFLDALSMFRKEDAMLMPWENARGRRIRDEHLDNPGAHTVGVLIGPEGGISSEEADAAVSAGAKPVTLGPRILRAETAAVAAMAVVMHLWGDL